MVISPLFTYGPHKKWRNTSRYEWTGKSKFLAPLLTEVEEVEKIRLAESECDNNHLSSILLTSSVMIDSVRITI